MFAGFYAYAFKAVQIDFLDFFYVGLYYNLKLVIASKPVRVLAVPAVCRPSAGLDVGSPPVFSVKALKERVLRKSSGSDFGIVRFEDYASEARPETFKLEY